MKRAEGSAGAMPIDIRGARGPNAITINGIYEPTDDICNNWTVYRKRGDSNKWLEFFDASKKWYIKATSDKGKARGWMRLACNPPSRPEQCQSVCEVWDGTKWTSQSYVSILTLKQRREDDKKMCAERRNQAVPVDIRGATGPSATSINGVYEVTNENSGGWPVYKKQQDEDKWLEYNVTSNEWYVKPTADKGRAEGWMCLSADQGQPCRPEQCRGVCEVWDGDKWTVQGSVTVLTVVGAFENMLEVQIFCAEEIKTLQKKLNGSLRRVLNLLSIPADKTEEGHAQMDGLLADIENKLSVLKGQKTECHHSGETKTDAAALPTVEHSTSS